MQGNLSFSRSLITLAKSLSPCKLTRIWRLGCRHLLGGLFSLSHAGHPETQLLLCVPICTSCFFLSFGSSCWLLQVVSPKPHSLQPGASQPWFLQPSLTTSTSLVKMRPSLVCASFHFCADTPRAFLSSLWNVPSLTSPSNVLLPLFFFF